MGQFPPRDEQQGRESESLPSKKKVDAHLTFSELIAFKDIGIAALLLIREGTHAKGTAAPTETFGPTCVWSCFGYILTISLTHRALEDLRAEWIGYSLSCVPVTFTSAPVDREGRHNIGLGKQVKQSH